MTSKARTGAPYLRSRRLTVGAAVGVVIVVAAVAVAYAVRTPRHDASVPVSPPTQSGNTRAAEAEATRLLDAAPLPAGAKRTTRAPAHLTGPPTTPAVSEVVDRFRLVSVPLSYDTSLAYLRTHTPVGLPAASGNGNEGGPGYVVGYLTWYDDTHNPAYTSPQLLISVEETGPQATVWRLDGQVLPLDPNPQLLDADGPATAVSVAGGCPSTKPARLADDQPGASRRLLPDGMASGGLVCSYVGPRLIAHRQLGSVAAEQLADALRAIPLAHVDGAVSSCPSDGGAGYLLVVSIDGLGDVATSYDPGGCGRVDNGVIAAGPPASVSPALGAFVMRALSTP